MFNLFLYFLMHFGVILVSKCSKMEWATAPLFRHFGTLAPQGRPRGPLGVILVAFLVPVPPFWCHFGDILDPFVTISVPRGCHFRVSVPRGCPRGPLGVILMAFLVPVPPFWCHCGDIWDPF